MVRINSNGNFVFIIINIIISFLVVVTYNFIPDGSSGVHLVPLPVTTKAKLFLKRSHEYCNEFLSDTDITGSEGNLPFEGNDHYELIQVHMIARHGDRSPVHQTWLSKGLDIPCTFPKDEKHWSHLSDFTIQKLSAPGITPNENVNLFPGYRERLCKLGDLTHRGHLQHFLLGQFFAKQYAKQVNMYLDNDWSNNVFVHSTNYPRTLGSAASFLLGFLPDESAIRKSIPIHHSQGTTLYGAPRRVTMTYRWCTKLREIMKFHNEKLDAGRMFFSEAIDNVAAVFKKSPDTLPEPTVMVENFLVRMCHQKELPCHNDKCVNTSMAFSLLEYADWTIEHKYTATNSILMMQPFVYNSILKKIFEATDKLASGKQDYDKFLLYFAHDSTLTPLMTLLGIPPKKWVPYASRLVIELWKEKISSDPSESVGFGPYYIRILFNGQGWTRKLPLPEKSFALVRDLVKLRAFKKFLTTGKFRGKDSFDKECGLSQPQSDAPR